MNTQLNEFTLPETHQVSEYFKDIDTKIAVGDTNRRYAHSNNQASPINTRENDFVKFNISPVGENLADLYNTKIRSTLVLSFTIKEAVTAAAAGTDFQTPAFWIGYKEGVHAVSAYSIYANGREIYSQSSALPESFISGCAIPEPAKQDDTFSKAIHEDVWNRVDTVRSGAIFEPTNSSGVQKVEIPISFNLRRILPLSSIRFLPAFAGNIQLNIKFSTEALQVSPLSVEDCIGYNPANISKVVAYPKLTNKFVPFEETFKMIKSVAQDGTSKAITITSMDQKITKSSANFASNTTSQFCLSLDENVYTEMVNRYSQNALCFPIHTMEWSVMDGQLSNEAGKPSDLTATKTPLFVNSIFILTKRKQNYNCNYDNPLWEDVQLDMGSYGRIPADPSPSNSDAIKDLAANAINTNNDLVGSNLAVSRAFSATKIEETGYKSNDTTNFFLAFPTEMDFTFQQGQTSNSPINYKLHVKNTSVEKGFVADRFNERLEFGVFRHRCFSIGVKLNGPPDVRIDDWDFSASSSE